MSESTQAMPESYWSDLADEADRESERDSARFYGLKAEEYAEERFGLIQHETGHSDMLIPYEHRFSDRAELSGPDGRAYPGNRRKVQVKGARLKVKRGDGGRAGRFRLWEPDHEQLVADEALYLFLGYDPDEPVPVEYVRFIRAGDLADEVDGLTWYDVEHDTKRGRPTQLSVKRIFPSL